LLRQSVSRINIQRGKKLNNIAKKKDDICKHLESGNEVNAKIWVSPLHNGIARSKHSLMRKIIFQSTMW